jgi:hypothetical protein
VVDVVPEQLSAAPVRTVEALLTVGGFLPVGYLAPWIE